MSQEATRYVVIVGNIATVYDGTSQEEADQHYNEYLSQSKDGYGRAAGEPVTLTRNGEPIREWEGTIRN